MAEQFNSLNWFDSVEEKLQADKRVLEAKVKKVSPDIKKVMKNANNLYDDDNFEETLSI